MSNIADEVVAQQLQASENIRFVIVHPNYVQQRRVVSHLLGTDAALYICFQGHNLNYDQLNQQLVEGLHIQLNMDRLTGIRCLIIDECDRAQAGDLSHFLGGIAPQMAGGRVVIFSRTVPDYIYTNPELREQSCFIPFDSQLMMPDFAHPEGNQELLEVNALGSGRVTLNGRPVVDWDGTLPRALFFFLVDKGLTNRKQIFETFWPNLSVREATNVFHVTKRKISEVLGVDLTRYWSGFYRISPDIQLSYDISAFSQFVTDSAIASNDDAAVLLSRAIYLYKFDFLTSIDMPWAQKRREELFLMYGEALNAFARLKETNDEKDEALGLYIRASVTNPQREDIARKIMTLYAQKGLIDQAEATYRLLVDALDRLGIPPANETQELIGQIRLDADAAM